MLRTIVGFQHDPALVIMNGIPTYMTNGNTYRDKVLNRVTLDYICFIDAVAEQTHVAKSTATQTQTQTDTPVYQRTMEDRHDDTLPMKRRTTSKRNIRAGGSRHYKKMNTRMRVNGMDAKLSMEREDIQDKETQCIHSTRYYERAQEFEDMLQNYYVDMEKEYEDYLDNIGRYRDSDYYCC